MLISGALQFRGKVFVSVLEQSRKVLCRKGLSKLVHIFVSRYFSQSATRLLLELWDSVFVKRFEFIEINFVQNFSLKTSFIEIKAAVA